MCTRNNVFSWDEYTINWSSPYTVELCPSTKMITKVTINYFVTTVFFCKISIITLIFRICKINTILDFATLEKYVGCIEQLCL